MFDLKVSSPRSLLCGNLTVRSINSINLVHISWQEVLCLETVLMPPTGKFGQNPK